MITPFEVLSPNQNIHQHFIVEASAGTGKTFSIENLVVRLLLEENRLLNAPLTIEQILIVTFTRAATLDLKVRIRKNLEEAISLFRSIQSGVPQENTNLRYLLPYATSEESLVAAKRRLESSLRRFDQSQIFTIHGFCSRMLKDNTFEGDLSLDASGSEENQVPVTELKRIIKDLFRTEIRSENYSPAQIALVLKKHKGQIDKLENELLRVVRKGMDIETRPSYSVLYNKFLSAMTTLKEEHHFTPESLFSDYQILALQYTKPTDDPEEAIERFTQLFGKEGWSENDFDTLLQDGLVLLDVLHPSKLRKRPKASEGSSIQHPDLLSTLQTHLKPIIDEASDPLTIFTRMAHDCQKLMRRHLREEEKMNFDDLLTNMQAALNNPLFLEKVQSKYPVAIIDEFQDTDPIQWGIFKSLFLNELHHLYLVGDPKQSIYGFRQADIYTYLSAVQSMDENSRGSLDTNFRSQPALVNALNSLFSPKNTPELFKLPNNDNSIHYRPVMASKSTTPKDFNDNKKALHFFIGETITSRKDIFPLESLEENLFFPFMIEEIQRLNKQNHVLFKNIAILVGDRFQADRMSKKLKEFGIPFSQQKSASLADSKALPALKELLKAVIHPKNESCIKTALGGQIIGWNEQLIHTLETNDIYEEVLYKLLNLRKTLLNRGFSSFYEELLLSSWHQDKKTVMERLLLRENGHELFNDLQQISELVMEATQNNALSLDGILVLLDDFETMQANDDARIKKISDTTKDAVNIITIHSSKGLEYEIVFALGVVKRSKEPEQLVPNRERALVAIPDKENNKYLEYCEEIDAEKMRQLYVAMTRAKHRLYVPVAFCKNGVVKMGGASPMDLFLARFLKGDNNNNSNSLYSRINECSPETLLNFLNSNEDISYTLLNDKTFTPEFLTDTQNISLSPPSSFNIPGEILYMHSFTSLSRHIESANEPTQTTPTPQDFHATNKNIHTLPAGSETGNILHLILETIPFNTTDIKSHLLPLIKGTLFEEWIDLLTSATETILNTYIEGFQIKDIEQHHCYREAEFLYPTFNAPPLEEIEHSEGFLKGFIDLVFIMNGKYYILDWKSNWLGPTTEDYLHENMEAAMHHHHYHLQAALYKEALKRYLALFTDAPFEEIFGGTYYLFLRGLDTNKQTGIYFIPPQHKELHRS